MSSRLNIALTSVAACMGLCSPVHAAPQAGAWDVKGNVASSCTNGNTGAITLSTTVGSTGALDPTLHDRTWVIPGWYCSSASTIKLSSTSLRLSSPRTSLKNNESQTVNFTSRAKGWSATEARVTTSDKSALGTVAAYTGPAQTQNTAKTGTITLKVDDFIVVGSSPKSTPKLIPGSYSARIVITLSPGL
jgi:hypothetical protein